MDQQKLRTLLENIKNGSLAIENAMEQFKNLDFEDVGFAKVDHHRKIRNGFPEVVYCEGKTPEQVQAIIGILMKENNNLLATRASKEVYEKVLEITHDAIYHEFARMIVVKRREEIQYAGTIAVITAGTADIPVAEEAAITCEVMGNKVDRIFDVGVAGIHRLFAQQDRILSAHVIVVVAGMDGALASVVGGLVEKPVVAVPTSVGYGASFGGISALLTMLNSCASGVGVVNIDNGFGGGYLAALINRL